MCPLPGLTSMPGSLCKLHPLCVDESEKREPEDPCLYWSLGGREGVGVREEGKRGSDFSTYIYN